MSFSGALSQGAPAVTTGMVIVFAIIMLAIVLFITEIVPIDVTAISVMFLLMILGPWTNITVREGISGFSNPATITVLAMLILSAGISKTGLVQILGRKLANFAGTSKRKQLLSTIGVAGPASGIINNTPVVAVLVPVISDLAHKGKTSPSKLLIPLSYASMLGGTLTLIGTSTNILASDISDRLLQHPFSMFEFTALGAIVLVIGSIYLMTIGYRLLPERVPAEEDYLEGYEMEDYLTEVRVRPDSPLLGMSVEEAGLTEGFDADIVQLIRAGERFSEPLARKEIRAGDKLLLRTDRRTLRDIMSSDSLDLVARPTTEKEMRDDETPSGRVIEIVIPSGSILEGETLQSSTFRERYDANVLALRSRGETIHTDLDNLKLRKGDTLLIQASEDSIKRLSDNRDFIVANEIKTPTYRQKKIPVALSIIAAVILLPAFNLVPIVVSALGGVVAMVVTGILDPDEIYDAVDWNIIFLLAGLIPMGIALEQTGAAQLIGSLVAGTATFLSPVLVLWVFYVLTGLITQVISNNASVVLMIPIGISTAQQIGANPFAFVLAVTFSASTAFMTPLGYQTNLFVYGPGGYRFTDYMKVGGPLQLLLSIVTVAGIALMWGV